MIRNCIPRYLFKGNENIYSQKTCIRIHIAVNS